jgi:hypothetical protein
MLRPAGGMRDRLSDAFATELQAGAEEGHGEMAISALGWLRSREPAS